MGLTAGDFVEVKAWDTLGDLTRQNAPFMDDFRYKPPYRGSPSMKSWDNKYWDGQKRQPLTLKSLGPPESSS